MRRQRQFRSLALLVAAAFLAPSLCAEPSLEEAIKLTYREKDWDRFFGRAYYLRTRKADHAGHATSVLTKGEAEAQLLEIVALLRHCQWHRAQALYRTFAATSAAVVYTEETRTLAGILSFFNEAPLPKAEEQELRREESRTRRRLWKVNSGKKRKLSPMKLRLHVPNLCAEETL